MIRVEENCMYAIIVVFASGLKRSYLRGMGLLKTIVKKEKKN